MQDARRFAPPPPPPPPRTPRFTTPPPPPPPRRPEFETPYESYGRRPRGGGVTPVLSGAVAGTVIGSQIASAVEGAIVKGFQIGTDLMMRPFQYFLSAFGERVQDELSDLKSAGGFYSIAQRQTKPFLQSIDEAIQFQQDTNRTFAKMAAALPGVTSDYVQTSKRLGDTIARIVTKDMPGAIREANKIRATEEGRQFYGAPITAGATTQVQQQQAIQTLLGEFTKKTVLAGLGGRAGAGGMMGPYGLPGLAERILSQEQVSMSQFQRYAAIFSDPMIADALARNVDKINATQKDSMARLEAFNKMIDEIVTPELVDKLRTSFDGVAQSLKSAFIDPDTGLFGLGRQIQGLGKRLNAYGQYVDKFGKVVTDVTQAASVDLSLYEMLRDVFVQAGQVIAPLISYIPEVFDPLRNIANALKDARHYTAEFLRTFNSYREGLKAYAKGLGGQAQLDIMGTLDVRASLAAFNNLFAEFGVYGKETEKTFTEIANKLKDPKANIGEILNGMLKTLFTSDIAKNIGKFIGELIGTVLKQVGDTMKYITDAVEGGGFAGGFINGFKKAGGFQAIQDIFVGLIKMFVKALGTAITQMPILSATVTALFFLPGVIGAAVASLVEKAIDLALTGGREAIKKAILNVFKVKPVKVEDLGTRITDPRKQLPAASSATKQNAIVVQTTGTLTRLNKVLSSFMSYVKGIGPRFTGFFKGFLGKLSIFGAAITSIISLFQGKDFATALAEGAGPLLGAALGSALIPFLGPIGPMIGAAIGGWVGSLKSVTEPLAQGIQSVFDTFSTTFDLLIQIGKDLFGLIDGLIQLIPGVSSEFSALRLAITALLSPFRLLELMIIGLYEGYLRVKEQFLGLSEEEKSKKNELYQKRLERTAALELDFRQAYNKEARKAYQEELDRLRASGKGGEERARTVEKILSQIDTKLKQIDKTYTAPTPVTPYTEQKVPEQKLPKPNLWEQYSSWWAGNVNKFVEGVKSLPDNLAWLAGYAWQKTTEVWQGIQRAFTALGNWLTTLPGKLQGAISKVVSGLQQAWNNFISWFTKLPSLFSSKVSSVKSSLNSGTQQIVNAVVNWIKNLPGRIVSGFTAGQQAAKPKTTKTETPAKALGEPGVAFGSLGQAISYEQKNKPPGSDLVIANTSETVIPAAGGYGMMNFVETLRSGVNAIVNTYLQSQQRQEQVTKVGFNSVTQSYREAQQKQNVELARINQTLVSNQRQTNDRLTKLETKFTVPSAGGLGGAAAGGGVDAFTPIAQRFGLQMTSGYRPGDPGWHGANRARDFSNGTGPTPQMMQFAQYMASTYGANLKELIYTPLGYSIKNGQKVAPYAQAGHYNHVHVAYNQGNMAPLLEEMKAMPKGAKVAAVNSSEFVANKKQTAMLATALRGYFEVEKLLRQLIQSQADTSLKNLTVEFNQASFEAPIIDPVVNPAVVNPVVNNPVIDPVVKTPGVEPIISPTVKQPRIEPNVVDSFVNPFVNQPAITPEITPSRVTVPTQPYANQGGGPTEITVNAPITITQQPGQSADELASIVALKIGEAVAEARAASIFV